MGGEESLYDLESWRSRRNYRMRVFMHERDKKRRNTMVRQRISELAREPIFYEYIKDTIEKILTEYSSPSYKRTGGSIIYEKLKKDLEEHHMGKIVAIDLKQAKVVGIGNTIEEAYTNALTKSTNKKFYFRKVGKQYLTKL